MRSWSMIVFSVWCVCGVVMAVVLVASTLKSEIVGCWGSSCLMASASGRGSCHLRSRRYLRVHHNNTTLALLQARHTAVQTGNGTAVGVSMCCKYLHTLGSVSSTSLGTYRWVVGCWDCAGPRYALARACPVQGPCRPITCGWSLACRTANTGVCGCV